MDHSPIVKYVAVMEEVKKRTAVIQAFLSGDLHALYRASSVESIGIQFRKIFELIAFAL